LQFDGFDKIAHLGAFGLLAGLVFNGLRQSGRPWTSGGLFLIPVLFVALYGASDELHQYFVPTRSCDVLDWLADVTGALVAVTGLSVLFRIIGSPVQEPVTSSGE
jgi:VanZ family protein